MSTETKLDAIGQKTIGELVCEQPTRAIVFERHHINIIKSANELLSSVAEKSELSVSIFSAEFSEIDQAVGQFFPCDWYVRHVRAMIHEFETVFHKRFNEEFLRLLSMLDVAEPTIDPSYASPREIKESFFIWAAAAQVHISSYRQMLSPICTSLEEPKQVGLVSGTIARVVELMEAVNEHVVTERQKLSATTRAFSYPSDADKTYRDTIEAIKALDSEFDVHNEQEHLLLFPILRAAQSQRPLEDVSDAKPGEGLLGKHHDPLLATAKSWHRSSPLYSGGYSHLQFVGIAILTLTAMFAGNVLFPMIGSLLTPSSAETQTISKSDEAKRNAAFGYPLVEKMAQQWHRNRPQ